MCDDTGLYVVSQISTGIHIITNIAVPLFCTCSPFFCPFFIVNLRFCVLLAGIAVPCIESGYWREPAAATIDISDFSTFKIFRCEVYDVCRGEAVAVGVGCL